MTFPDTKYATYAYDDAHNVIETVDPAGNEIDDTFDDLNRYTNRSITLATGFIGTTSETRVFDPLGRITSNADNDYKVEYEYAVIGLKSYVAKETQSYVGQTCPSRKRIRAATSESEIEFRAARKNSATLMGRESARN